MDTNLTFEGGLGRATCFWPDCEGPPDEAGIARQLTAALEVRDYTQVGEVWKVREASMRGFYFCADGEKLLPNG